MLKKLKSLFIIEETAGKEKKVDQGATADKTEQASPAGRSFASSGGGTGEGQVQDRFLEVLFSALEASNREGFDYMEFKDFFRSLADLPMDDATRYKSAFATAQTMGATRENIISSARHYIGVLDKEKTKFQEALEGQRARNLTGKQDEIRQLEKAIKDKVARIEALQAEIDAHRNTIGSLEQEIESAAEKLAQTANDFEATYRALQGQIEADVQNIESHL